MERVLKIAEVCAIVGMSPNTLLRAVTAGDFPPPIRLTPARRGWRGADILRWVASRDAGGSSSVTVEASFEFGWSQ